LPQHEGCRRLEEPGDEDDGVGEGEARCEGC